MKGKAIMEINSDDSWKSHYKEYGSSNKSKKTLLINLGIAVFDEEADRQSQLAAKEKEGEKRKKASATVTPAKKAKKKNTPALPKILVIDIMSPVQYCTQHNVTRTDSASPLGSMRINFADLVAKYNPPSSNGQTSTIVINEDVNNNDSNSIDYNRNLLADSDSESSIGLGDNGSVGIRNDEIEERNDELMSSIDTIQKEINADSMPTHIYDGIRSAMGTAILTNKTNKYKKYEGKIGKKVSDDYYIQFIQSNTNSNTHQLFLRAVFMELTPRINEQWQKSIIQLNCLI